MGSRQDGFVFMTDSPTEARIHSVVPGIGWPAIGSDAAAHLLSLLFQLEQTQWMPEQKLRDLQLVQAKILLRHAQTSVPYYSESLSGIDIDRLDWDSFRSLPLLTRSNLQENFVALKSASLPREHGGVGEGKSSGSTGRPARFLSTSVNQLFWNALTLREHFWHNRLLTGKLASIRNESENGTWPDWGPPTSTVCQTGAGALLRIDTPIAKQADWLHSQNPDYLLSYPTNILALAKHCEQSGIRLPRLREVRSMGEVVTTEMRETCRRVWGVPVTDMYSCQEAGYLALQCPVGEHYHVQAESVILEILHTDGRLCQAGEVGQVVITSLHNFAMPLIRYAIGDFAERGEACACGRGLPVIRRIVGRARNILTYPSGETRFPLLGGERYAEIAPVKQYQAIQRSLHEIEMRLIVDRPLASNEEAALREFILAKLGYPFNLSFSYPSRIPMGAGGKFEDFISEIV